MSELRQPGSFISTVFAAQWLGLGDEQSCKLTLAQGVTRPATTPCTQAVCCQSHAPLASLATPHEIFRKLFTPC